MADLDSTLRGDAYGQLTPEGQGLWSEYNNLLNARKNMPLRKMNLRSGASINIPDPGVAMQQGLLAKTLRGMTNTGLGTRAKPQPGYLSQLAPFFIAMGMGSDDKGKGKGGSNIMDLISKYFGSGSDGDGSSYVDSIGSGEDWWSNAPSDDGDWMSSIFGSDWGE